jgi:short subunit dehydrogenase-like uncharacterized protein
LRWPFLGYQRPYDRRLSYEPDPLSRRHRRELDVFLAAQRQHANAQAAGIVICPGVGFDVIPTDCLAAVLKEALPDATHLVLAFDARTHVSPGTARTMAESFRLGRRGGRVRRNGVIEEVPFAHSRRRVDFAGGSAAYVSTGIPNIETYASMPLAAALASRTLDWARPFLAWTPVQKLLRRLADRSTGPSNEDLRTERSRATRCRPMDFQCPLFANGWSVARPRAWLYSLRTRSPRRRKLL